MRALVGITAGVVFAMSAFINDYNAVTTQYHVVKGDLIGTLVVDGGAAVSHFWNSATGRSRG
jgi:hypothetical protein